MKKLSKLASLLMLCALGAACGPSFTAKTPSGFVSVLFPVTIPAM